MPVNINCFYNDRGAWCKNKNIKRSLLGIGARCCKEFPDFLKTTCSFKIEQKRPTPPPAPKRKE